RFVTPSTLTHFDPGTRLCYTGDSWSTEEQWTSGSCDTFQHTAASKNSGLLGQLQMKLFYRFTHSGLLNEVNPRQYCLTARNVNLGTDGAQLMGHNDSYLIAKTPGLEQDLDFNRNYSFYMLARHNMTSGYNFYHRIQQCNGTKSSNTWAKNSRTMYAYFHWMNGYFRYQRWSAYNLFTNDDSIKLISVGYAYAANAESFTFTFAARGCGRNAMGEAARSPAAGCGGGAFTSGCGIAASSPRLSGSDSGATRFRSVQCRLQTLAPCRIVAESALISSMSQGSHSNGSPPQHCVANLELVRSRQSLPVCVELALRLSKCVALPKLPVCDGHRSRRSDRRDGVVQHATHEELGRRPSSSACEVARQARHVAMKRSVSSCILGHQTLVFSRSSVLRVHWCPRCARSSTSRRSATGTMIRWPRRSTPSTADSSVSSAAEDLEALKNGVVLQIFDLPVGAIVRFVDSSHGYSGRSPTCPGEMANLTAASTCLVSSSLARSMTRPSAALAADATPIDREPFDVPLGADLELTFFGHFAEPPIRLKLPPPSGSSLASKLRLRFDVDRRQWLRELVEPLSAAFQPVVDGDVADQRWGIELALPPFGQVIAGSPGSSFNLSDVNIAQSGALPGLTDEGEPAEKSAQALQPAEPEAVSCLSLRASISILTFASTDASTGQVFNQLDLSNVAVQSPQTEELQGSTSSVECVADALTKVNQDPSHAPLAKSDWDSTVCSRLRQPVFANYSLLGKSQYSSVRFFASSRLGVPRFALFSIKAGSGVSGRALYFGSQPDCGAGDFLMLWPNSVPQVVSYRSCWIDRLNNLTGLSELMPQRKLIVELLASSGARLLRIVFNATYGSSWFKRSSLISSEPELNLTSRSYNIFSVYDPTAASAQKRKFPCPLSVLRQQRTDMEPSACPMPALLDREHCPLGHRASPPRQAHHRRSHGTDDWTHSTSIAKQPKSGHPDRQKKKPRQLRLRDWRQCAGTIYCTFSASRGSGLQGPETRLSMHSDSRASSDGGRRQADARASSCHRDYDRGRGGRQQGDGGDQLLWERPDGAAGSEAMVATSSFGSVQTVRQAARQQGPGNAPPDSRS
uniref:CUB domain-containing protein n=1 Tax=Macrostomum lignano TaxID=282301 RepID=A0A1I8H6U3_9PLAT